jgi:hypothetical protein
MINKDENITVGVYWDDVSIPSWKLSGWSNAGAIISSKNCENYSRSTLGVARRLRSYWDRRADVGCCVLLCAPAQERPWNCEGPTPRYTNMTTVICPRKSKTAMRKPANEAGLLYSITVSSTAVPCRPCNRINIKPNRDYSFLILTNCYHLHERQNTKSQPKVVVCIVIVQRHFMNRLCHCCATFLHSRHTKYCRRVMAAHRGGGGRWFMALIGRDNFL